LGIGTNIDLLENRVCSGHFHFYYLFVKFTHHERIKTNNRCCFYLSVFATVFAIGLGKDELNLVKNTVGNFDIFVVYPLPKALREKNGLHMVLFYIIINK
jgi:hypothetical protein